MQNFTTGTQLSKLHSLDSELRGIYNDSKSSAWIHTSTHPPTNHSDRLHSRSRLHNGTLVSPDGLRSSIIEDSLADIQLCRSLSCHRPSLLVLTSTIPTLPHPQLPHSQTHLCDHLHEINLNFVQSFSHSHLFNSYSNLLDALEI